MGCTDRLDSRYYGETKHSGFYTKLRLIDLNLEKTNRGSMAHLYILKSRFEYIFPILILLSTNYEILTGKIFNFIKLKELYFCISKAKQQEEWMYIIYYVYMGKTVINMLLIRLSCLC